MIGNILGVKAKKEEKSPVADMASQLAIIEDYLCKTQQELIASVRMLDKAILFIEQLAGAKHKGNLHFERSYSTSTWGNRFSINALGEVCNYDVSDIIIDMND
jgi:hypothetical protein